MNVTFYFIALHTVELDLPCSEVGNISAEYQKNIVLVLKPPKESILIFFLTKYLSDTD